MNFDTAFDKVIGHEGGYVNNPRDPGGETKYGISKRSYPNEDIPNLMLWRAKEIYRADYWDKMRADALPDGLRHYLFDTAVNCGWQWAAASLQRAAGVLPDADIGPKTLMAVKAQSPQHLLRMMFVDRAMQYALSPNDHYYGAGWFVRLFDVTTLAIVAIDPRCGAAA